MNAAIMSPHKQLNPKRLEKVHSKTTDRSSIICNDRLIAMAGLLFTKGRH